MVTCPRLSDQPPCALSHPSQNRQHKEPQLQGKEEGGGGRTSRTVPWVSPNNGVGSTLFISGWRHLPGYPHPAAGSQVRQRREWVAGAVASIFGNLLMPGDHLSDHSSHRQGWKEERSGGEQQNNLFCAREEGSDPRPGWGEGLGEL